MSLLDAASSARSSVSSAASETSQIITNARSNLDTLANKYLLKPANAKGLAGFVFDYEGDTTVLVQSEITDHYSEQNVFFNDHAAQRPQRIILRGFVGELAVNPDRGVLGVLNTLQDKLTTLPAILGKYTPGAVQKLAAVTTQATNVVNKVDDAINRAQNILGFLKGSSVAPTKQQTAYQELVMLWQNNTVFTLDTPFNYFGSVMIENITMVQDESTRDWSDVIVTVKQVRFLGNPAGPGLSAQAAFQQLQGRAAYSGQSSTNRGKTQGVASSFSAVKSFFTSRN